MNTTGEERGRVGVEAAEKLEEMEEERRTEEEAIQACEDRRRAKYQLAYTHLRTYPFGALS